MTCKVGEKIRQLRLQYKITQEQLADRLGVSYQSVSHTALKEESRIRALLNRYASDQTTAKDYLLKERYLFRDEFENFETARQRYFHKQIAHLIDGDISLWRDSSKPMSVEHTMFENNCKLALLHSLCQETPSAEHPITRGNTPDVFAEQRIYIGMRQACVYTYLGEKEKAYAVLEDIVSLMECIMTMSNGA